jgi:hypothetical protein
MDLFKKHLSENQQQNFGQIANFILNGANLNVNGHLFRIAEIEFYIYNHAHPDIFTHQSKDQMSCFGWYFHKSSDGKYSYRGGTFKGLDLTCGSGTTYGGILIRSIVNLSNGELTDGPCRVVNKILELTKCENIKELVCQKMSDDLSADNQILCLKENKMEHKTIFRSPRIGLTLKKSDHLDLRKLYISKLYRYTTYPTKISKGKKMTLLASMDTIDEKEVINMFCLNKSQLSDLKTQIEKMETERFDCTKYLGSDLSEIQRMEIYFNYVKKIPPITPIKEKIQTIAPIKKKIQLKIIA